MSEVSKSATQDVDSYDYGDNYDPAKIEVEEIINAVFAMDVSGSIGPCVKDLNNALNEFTERMQKSQHAKDKLFVSRVDFNNVVEVAHGFKPILELQTVDLTKSVNGPNSGGTKLYDGVKTALKNALDYRKSLEQGGVNVKTLLFVITDGDDIGSSSPASDVKDIITELRREERNIMSFESILFGVGTTGSFKTAKDEMGINLMAQVGTTADEIRKMITFISASVTSVSQGQGMSAPSF